MTGAQPGHPETGTHAPKGGVVIAGVFFNGGEYISKEVLAQVSPEKQGNLQKHGSTLGKLESHTSELRNHLRDALAKSKEASPEEKQAIKSKFFKEHQKMLMGHYHEAKESLGIDPGDTIRNKLQKSHDYFRDRGEKEDRVRGGWDADKVFKFKEDLKKAWSTASRDAKNKALSEQGIGAEWPNLSTPHQKMSSSMERWLSISDAGNLEGVYKKALVNISGKMSEGAADLVNQNVRGMVFHKNNYQLKKAMKYSHGPVAGFYSYSTRTAHCGPGSDSGYANQLTTEGIAAHEISHGIDHRGKLSNSQEWQKAWQEEIYAEGHPLSDYAASNSIEGFAEFGRAMFGGMEAENIAKIFPKCLAFWKMHVDGGK